VKPGCSHFDEVNELIREATEFHVEGVLQHGEAIPAQRDLRIYNRLETL
jgi:predicted RNase H-like HicB family nuclease